MNFNTYIYSDDIKNLKQISQDLRKTATSISFVASSSKIETNVGISTCQGSSCTYLNCVVLDTLLRKLKMLQLWGLFLHL